MQGAVGYYQPRFRVFALCRQGNVCGQMCTHHATGFGVASHLAIPISHCQLKQTELDSPPNINGIPTSLLGWHLLQAGGVYITRLLDNMTHAAQITVRNKAV